MGSVFTEDSAIRKQYPVFTGWLMYFPKAAAICARLSLEGNKKHNPGEALHWARDKSQDHEDCIIRHLMDGDYAEAHWRTGALLQIKAEEGYEPVWEGKEATPSLPPLVGGSVRLLKWGLGRLEDLTRGGAYTIGYVDKEGNPYVKDDAGDLVALCEDEYEVVQ